MFSRRAKSFDVLVGGLAGAITSYLVAYHSGLSFLWPSTFGLLATLLAGFVVRLLRWKSDDVEAPLTWSAVMQRAPRV
jgi:uncharacterized membrane protein YeaQ/YmgE (transglycosylase-associated protein family)